MKTVKERKPARQLMGILALFPLVSHAEPEFYSSEQLFKMSLEELADIRLFSESVRRSFDLKWQAGHAQDAILASDIASFPDLNLAESIQRLPGVAITREGNEGRQIALRGTQADFTRVQLNGMETMAKTTSPMDSRNAITQDRSFDFNIFASEMFSQIVVHKSNYAAMDEGGIGGTVSLKTPRAFDYDGNLLVMQVKAGQNTLTSGDVSPRLSLLASDTWGNWGGLVSLAYSNRDIVERGYNTFRWRQRSTSDYNPDLPSEIIRDLEAGELWFARGNRYSVWENTQERIGANVAVDYQTQPNRKIGFTGFYAELNNSRYESHLATRGSASTAVGRVENIQTQEINGHQEVIFGEFSELTMRTERRHDEADTRYQQWLGDVQWALNSRWTFDMLLGWSESKFSQPVHDKVYFETAELHSIITDFRPDRFYAQNTYSFDPAQSDAWQVSEIDLREDKFTDTFSNFKTSLTLDLNKQTSLSAGINLKRYDHYTLRLDDPDYLKSQPTPNNNNERSVEPFSFTFTESRDAQWAVAEIEPALAFYGLQTELDRSKLTDEESLREDTTGVFAQWDFNDQLFGKVMRGNLGVRYYQTSVTMDGRVNQEAVTLTHHYNDWLPSANLAFELNPDLLWRTSASRNINRATLTEQKYQSNIDSTERTVDASSSNVILEPFLASNVETSLEWRLSKVDYITAALFAKEISGYTETVVSTVPYLETGLPSRFLAPEQEPTAEYSYSRLENNEDAFIRGAEISFHHSLDFIPSGLAKPLGIVGNFTIVRGESAYNNVQGLGETITKNALGLSEQSWNLSLYYETQQYGLRFSGSYRDDYIARVEAGNTDEDERGFQETFHLDGRLYVKWGERWLFSLEGNNLTDEKEVQYSDSNNRAYNTTESGRTYYLGVSYRLD